MPFLLLILFIGVPLLELYVIIRVGGEIGALPTIAILVGAAVLGTALLRSQGRAAWQRFNQALAEGRVPAREIFDGALIILGGALLLTPGFITDVFGLLLLLPPTRAAIRRASAAIVRTRLAAGQRVAVWGFQRARGRYGQRSATGAPSPVTRPGDIEGTAEEVQGDTGESPSGDRPLPPG